MASGMPLSQWHKKHHQPGIQYPCLMLATDGYSRPQIHQRIEQRFHQMLDQGLIAEVEPWFKQFDDPPACFQSVGYKQVWQYLAGEIDYQTMIQKAIEATRQLAKRQYTWMRSMPDLHWLKHLPYLDEAKKIIQAKIHA